MTSSSYREECPWQSEKNRGFIECEKCASKNRMKLKLPAKIGAGATGVA
jgi:hypothetical protein